MPTVSQFAANRLNAQHSTGPRSAEGKAAVRFNALKHAADAKSMYLPGEDPAEREAISQSYIDKFQPQDEDEAFQVETLVDCTWNIRRLTEWENRMLNFLSKDSADPAETLARIQLEGGPQAKALDKIFRKKQALRREYFQVRKQLMDARKQRQAAQQPPASSGNWLRSANSATSTPPADPAPKPQSEPNPVRPGPQPPR